MKRENGFYWVTLKQSKKGKKVKPEIARWINDRWNRFAQNKRVCLDHDFSGIEQVSIILPTTIQQSLILKGISIMVKHYESGAFSFTIMKHNTDATGWTKISPFMAGSFYNYNDALVAGINWYNDFESTKRD